MGKAAHFRSAHGVLGLLTFLLMIPALVFTWRRLNSPVPQPSPVPTTVKASIAVFKSPAKMYAWSALFVTLVLQFSAIAWIEGFSLLRSISLCVVDAILTSTILAGILMGVLFTQIGAMSVVALRMWIERRISTVNPNGNTDANFVEKSGKKGKKTDTIATFGFDTRTPLPSSTPTQSLSMAARPAMQTRNTKELLGREDSDIGRPFHVKKFGDEEALERDPFADPRTMTSPKVYDEKLGGFVEVVSPIEAGFRRGDGGNGRRSDDGRSGAYGVWPIGTGR
jgi:hypothetical protein